MLRNDYISAVFLLDAHLDLAINAVEFNRDLTREVSTIRELEAHLRDRPDRGRATVSLPELRKAGIGLCVATLLARVEMNAWSPVTGWRSQAQAWAVTQGQLAWYRAMEELGQMRQIRTRAQMEAHLAEWHAAGNGAGVPISYILSLEGADSLISLRHLERAYAEGLRAVGPAHYGPGVYAFGTDASGPLPENGKALLRLMDSLHMILDATHLCDECFWQALDLYEGPVWASHHMARALVPHNRQLSDEMFRALMERDAVVGMAFDAWMIVPGWIRGTTTPQSSGLTLEHAADHIDHYCQLAGNARHVGIGSDLDGGFGTEQTPQDLQTIADLQKLVGILSARGYSQDDIEGIFSGNFLRFLRKALPE